MVDTGGGLVSGYEPRQSSLKFNGSKDTWPAFRWQFLAIVNSISDGALEVLELPTDEIIAKKLAEVTKIKTEAKGQQAIADATAHCDKVAAEFPGTLEKRAITLV